MATPGANAMWLSSYQKDAAVHGLPFSPTFCDGNAPHCVTLCLTLGPSIAGTETTESSIDWFTTGDDALIPTAKVKCFLTVVYQDIDGATRINAGSMNVAVIIPMSSFTVLDNTCVSSPCTAGPQSLILSYGINMADHVSVSSASPTRASYRRTMVGLGIRGLLLVGSDDSPTFSREGSAITLTSVPTIMSTMRAGTTCTPDRNVDRVSCPASVGTAYASPVSTSPMPFPCASGYRDTPCIKMFSSLAPISLLIQLERVSASTYASGVWTAVPGEDLLVPFHIHTLGFAIANKSACFPYPNCGAAASSLNSTDGDSSKTTVTVIILLSVIAFIIVCVFIRFIGHARRSLSVKEPPRNLFAMRNFVT